jgi:CRP-like cAMP-binding protein
LLIRFATDADLDVRHTGRSCTLSLCKDHDWTSEHAELCSLLEFQGVAVWVAPRHGLQERFGRLVRTIAAGSVLGDMSLSEGPAATSRRTATAVAATPVTTLVIPKATFNAVLRARRDADVRAKLSLFRHVDALATLPRSAQDGLAGAMTQESVPLGAELARAGAPFSRLLLVRSGTVRMLRAAPLARGAPPLADAPAAPPATPVATPLQAAVQAASEVVEAVEVRGAGQVVGEDALVHGGVHACTAIAAEACEVYVLAAQVRRQQRGRL